MMITVPSLGSINPAFMSEPMAIETPARWLNQAWSLTKEALAA